MEHKPPKLVIVVRTDLKDKKGNPVGLGKLGVQVGHASHWWLKSKLNLDLTDEDELWLSDGMSRKILVEVGSEAELDDVYARAKAAGLTAHLIVDAGLTTFSGPTKTVVGIGPHYGERFDDVTGKLKLVR